jgi:hypothetical protein
MRSQKGMSMLGILVVLLVVGTLGTATVRLAPVYLDNWSLTRVLDGIVKEQSGTATSPAQVRQIISRHFVTNRIEVLSVRDLKISNQDEGVVIDASYEKRVPLMFNVDAVVKFEDAKYVIARP